MCLFDVVLIDLGIVERGIYADVSEESLHLLDGHSFIDSHGGHGTAELGGVDVMYLSA